VTFPTMKFRYLFASLTFASSALADGGLYHTTGSVISSDERNITIQHGTDKWTFERGGVLTEPLEVGSTVTIRYHMVADSAGVTEAKTKTTVSKPKPKAPAPETKPKDSTTDAKKKPTASSKPTTTSKPAKTTTTAKKKDQ
jgi:hypothetical protein